MKKKIFTILFILIFSLSYSQSFENDILTIGDISIKEGDNFQIGSREDSNSFKYIKFGQLRKLAAVAPVGAWGKSQVTVKKIKFIKKTGLYELTVKPEGIGGKINNLWITDVVKAIQEKEILLKQ